jgi:hypothetical protein
MIFIENYLSNGMIIFVMAHNYILSNNVFVGILIGIKIAWFKRIYNVQFS